MAYVGLRYPVVATVKTEVTGQALEYNPGMVMGKAISANINWTRNENPLYADDVIAEEDNGITGGSVEFNADDIDVAVRAYALGLEAVGQGGDVYEETGASAPYVGFGYMRVRRKNGATTYEAYWCHKVQFGESTENAQTKGETIEWQTPTLNGSIMGAFIDSSGNPKFRRRKICQTAAEAITWLNGLAGITP